VGPVMRCGRPERMVVAEFGRKVPQVPHRVATQRGSVRVSLRSPKHNARACLGIPEQSMEKGRPSANAQAGLCRIEPTICCRIKPTI